jgi:hypothetical protein
MPSILVHRPAGAPALARVALIRGAFTRLTRLSFPRRFPIVQFPNLALIVGLLAGALGNILSGRGHTYAASISYLALTVWAYEETAHGVNWFRRLLGIALLAYLVVRVADALHG